MKTPSREEKKLSGEELYYLGLEHLSDTSYGDTGYFYMIDSAKKGYCSAMEECVKYYKKLSRDKSEHSSRYKVLSEDWERTWKNHPNYNDLIIKEGFMKIFLSIKKYLSKRGLECATLTLRFDCRELLDSYIKNGIVFDEEFFRIKNKDTDEKFENVKTNNEWCLIAKEYIDNMLTSIRKSKAGF